MDDNSGWWVIIAIVVLFAAVLGVAAVWMSDMPMWAKFMILMK